jgi:hypothetical protein
MPVCVSASLSFELLKLHQGIAGREGREALEEKSAPTTLQYFVHIFFSDNNER